jgi:hypothetical protein
VPRPPRLELPFNGAAFQAATREDVDRLAPGTGSTVRLLSGGYGVAMHDPSGSRCESFAASESSRRTSSGWAMWWWARTGFRGALNCCLDTLEPIVSGFPCLDGQRDRGPVMAFIRCDQEACPPTICILAMALHPRGPARMPAGDHVPPGRGSGRLAARLPQLAWSMPAGLVALTSRVAAALVIVVARKRRLASARGDLW